MKILFLILFFILNQLETFSQSFVSSSVPDSEKLDNSYSNLSVRAYDWIGGLSNLGFRIRDGQWLGRLGLGEQRFLSTYLFAGNKYWFCVATNAGIRKLNLMVINHDGNSENITEFSGNSIFAICIEPKFSGRYFIKLELTDGENSEFCLLYAYRKK